MLAHMKRAARDLVEPHNIQLKFEVGEALGKLRLSPEQRKNLYMVLKESVNNARKHAGASVIEVRFFMQGTQLVMTVSDNGRGFNPATPTSGNGLQNIRKRAEELSASLEIVSQPGKGTTISLSVPV
ncbi:MAG: ATP-binding protein [Flavobacteriales bacterium]|nr:ATP-binding protein [Flavobacteriales bacterium]